MKIKLLVLLLVLLGSSCKEGKKEIIPSINEVKQVKVKKLPSTIKEIASFAQLDVNDSTDINDHILFKEVDSDGTIRDIDMIRAISLYKKMKKRAEVTSLPVFELKNRETAILTTQGEGFGGAIWANVLVDRSTLEIKKIAFDHTLETEGYGAAMTLSSFEGQFVGVTVNLDKNIFTLNEALDKMKSDGQAIDGITGSTITSQGIVDMVNQGLKKYEPYLVD